MPAIVIGENMDRVRKAAEAIGARVCEIPWEGFWKTMANNIVWLYKIMKDGYKIVDIGIDTERHNRSPFYFAERFYDVLIQVS